MFNLNSNKHLNLLAFKEAFLLYNGWNSPDRTELVEQIGKIKAGMNSKRTEFLMPEEHKVVISPNWLLGFIEGDGSFSFKKLSKSAFFTLGQKGNRDLLLAIADYLHKRTINNLTTLKNPELEVLRDNTAETNNNWVTLSSSNGIYCISVGNAFYIQSVLIPLLDSLNWRTKKYLDYCDWKYIVAILIKGFHYLPDGVELIEKITSQMNDYRLSPFTLKVQSIPFKLEVEEFLTQPSNYEVRDGKLFILSLNRYRVDNASVSIQLVDAKTEETIKLFPSLLECANYLGIARSTVKSRAQKGKSFLLDNKEIKGILVFLSYYKV